MKRRKFPVLPAGILLLALALGTAAFLLLRPAEGGEAEKPYLYLAVADSAADPGRAAVRAVSAGISEAEATPEALLTRLLETPADPALRSPLPKGTSVRSITRAGRRVLVDFSGQYALLTGFDRTRADYCVTLTLCGCDGVREVVITAEGNLLTGVLTADDALLTSTERDFETIEVALYFRGAEGLEAEYRELAVPEGEVLPARIVRALIDGPETAGLSPLLPEETALVSLSVEDDGCCVVTLSDAFWEEVPPRVDEQRMVVDSIVSSLTSLDSVSSVLLRDESGARTAYGEITTGEPITYKPSQSEE